MYGRSRSSYDRGQNGPHFDLIGAEDALDLSRRDRQDWCSLATISSTVSVRSIWGSSAVRYGPAF